MTGSHNIIRWVVTVVIVTAVTWASVHVVQKPGPDAFGPRFVHFVFESWAFWVLLMLVGVPKFEMVWWKRTGIGFAIFAALAAIVAVLPF